MAIEKRLIEIEDVKSVTRRTGRAERDEHAEPVSNSELDITMKPGAVKAQVRQAIAAIAAGVPGVTVQIGQPIEHRLSQILSETPAAIAINVYGEDLSRLGVVFVCLYVFFISFAQGDFQCTLHLILGCPSFVRWPY